MDNTMATIPASYLKAATYCMAKKDIRFYLNGILLDFPGNRIVSTDGHRLFVGRLPEDCPTDWPAIIAPDSLILASLKAMSVKARAAESVFITLTETDDDATSFKRKINNVRIISTAGEFAAREVDATFPEYQRVIPPSASGEPSGFNFAYLSDAADAISWYARGRDSRYGGCGIAYNGSGPAVLSDPMSEDCLVVVMPMRVDVNGEFPNVLAPRPPSKSKAA